jgi:hypothetical protein
MRWADTLKHYSISILLQTTPSWKNSLSVHQFKASTICQPSKRCYKLFVPSRATTPGSDSIPAELLKKGGYFCTRTLHQYITEVWDWEIVSQQRDVNIVTICGNSRGISLLVDAGKVLAKVMLHRLVNKITEKMLPESPCSFRKKRSTVNMMFTAQQLQDFFMAFVDLSQAFNTVSRELPSGILLKVGCPVKFVNILCQFHDGMMARVAIGRQESVPFGVSIGVRQGCVFSPVLYNIFLLCVTQHLHKELEDRSRVAVVFRLDENLFNIRRFPSNHQCFD